MNVRVREFGYGTLRQKRVAQFIEARSKCFRRLTNKILEPIIAYGAVIFTSCRVELFTSSVRAKLLEGSYLVRLRQGYRLVGLFDPRAHHLRMRY